MSGDGFGMADCAFYPILAYMIHRGLRLDGMGCFAPQKYVERCGGIRAVSEARPDGWEKPRKTMFAKCESLVERKNQEQRSAGKVF
jgi:glutathione S-transferase